MKITFQPSGLHVLPPDYSFLAKAAAEGREASRKYWTAGGEADQKYPKQLLPWWPAPSDPPPGTDAAEDRRNRKLQKRGKF